MENITTVRDLYIYLRKNASPSDMDYSVSALSTLPKDHGKIVYMLMLYYKELKGEEIGDGIVYGGKSVSDAGGASFDPDKIPKELFSVISTYASIIATK